MLSLLHFLKKYKKESIISPLFKLLEASFELFIPLIMAQIIDVGIQQSKSGYIYKMGGVLVLLAVVGLTCSLIAQYFAAKAATGFSSDLRESLFAHINSFSYYELDKIGSSTLITRITNDVNQIQTCVNLVLRLFLRSPFIVFGAMIMAFTVDIKAALVFVVAIPLLSVVVFGIMLYTVPWYQKVQKKLDSLLLSTKENLSGVRVIRAFCRQKEEEKNFVEESDQLFTLQIFVGKISAFLNPLTYIIVNVSLIAILWIGGDKVDTGSLTKGEVLALVNYMSQILVELVKLVNLIITFTKSLACANRVQEIFEMQTSVIDNAAPTGQNNDLKTGCSIEFKNVSFSYPESKEMALSNLNFSIKPCETIGIIGGTGSGKSTLINLIPRFYNATKGEILLDNKPIEQYSLHCLHSRIGLVPQHAVLFKGTIRDNLKWGSDKADDKALMNALSVAQAKDIVEQKAEGLDFVVSQGGQNLSGGQKQRLTIARALVGNPAIIILDDSASALDFATDARLRAELAKLSHTMTTLIISQRASTVKNADRILVLDDGEIVGFADHDTLLAQCSVYQEIYYSQNSEQKEA